MTIEEAIEVIKKANVYSVEAIEELKSIEDKAIALDKYGEYYSVLQNCLREREACAVAIKALEKQIPKKPYLEGDGYADGQLVYDTWICPNCEKRYEVDYDNYDYCPKCGQHINRSEVEEC